MQLWPLLIFVTCIGACVGSFLNVVILRLPAGQGIVSPPSRCPQCEHRLAWYDNVPILGWLWLRGRCRYCRTPVSVQYPLIEGLTAVLFGGLFVLYYMLELRAPVAAAGLGASWPMLVLHLAMLAGLLAATLIDARHYIIPLGIPWLITALAVVGLPLATAAELQAPEAGLVPLAQGRWVVAGLAGSAGLALALGLLWMGLLPRSFEDDEAHDEQAGAVQQIDALPAHPHPRRETLKELLFVGFPIAGLVLGLVLGSAAWQAPGWVSVLSGTLLGYLIGGGIIWITRILGTLSLGREAMGLGDVHLLGAIGAVLGAVEAVLVFFVAPFFGIIAALGMSIAAAVRRQPLREIPYGPYLAGAAVVLMLAREPLWSLFVEPARVVLGF